MDKEKQEPITNRKAEDCAPTRLLPGLLSPDIYNKILNCILLKHGKILNRILLKTPYNCKERTTTHGRTTRVWQYDDGSS